MILSTIGLESRAKARHGKSREEMRKIQEDKQEELDSTITHL
jgi:adenylate kinase